MRLKISRSAAEERLTELISLGYQGLQWMVDDYQAKMDASNFDSDADNHRYEESFEAWGQKVLDALEEIFPTDAEAGFFGHPPDSVGTIRVGTDQRWFQLRKRHLKLIRQLEEIRDTKIGRYTDLPQQDRLYIEDVDSFRKVRDVNPGTVAHHLSSSGRLELSEDEVQLALERILDVSFHKKDWGGEENDLYTANVIVNGHRVSTAFMLKGNGLKSKALRIKDCGKNGDQLVRLIQSPAVLFIVQFVGQVDEAVIKDLEGKVRDLRSQGKEARFCVIDGQDTARVLAAYGEL